MKIAILGYGVVGKGVYKLSKDNNIEVKYILVRDKNKKLDVDSILSDDINEILNDKEVDTVVECMGGNNPAFNYCRMAILNKKNVVSSNKKMLVSYLKEINDLALENNVSLLYSSACGGGIPILHEINRISDIDSILELRGIMNGTSNYILDKMYFENIDFGECLKKAQELGYAERDPSDDIDGVDTANKVILASLLAFKKAFKLEDIFVKGIRNINIKDIEYFKENGYKCVLLGSSNGECLKVIPTIFKDSIFANIRTNNNCFMIDARDLGTQYYTGQGAGSLPTASNVVRDLKDINNSFSIRIDTFSKPNYDNDKGIYYVRNGKAIEEYVDKKINDTTFVSKDITISKLKQMITENSFVCEVKHD